MRNEDFCIVSSNCISGFWYRDIVKIPYEVPFIWSILKLSDMLYLIRNFDSIDYSNITAEISEGEIVRKDGSKWAKIILDNRINVYFVHYAENKNLTGETIVNGIRVISNNITKYAKDVWLRRCNRMPFNKKRVFVFWDDKISTDVELCNFINIAAERKDDIFVLFTPKSVQSSQKNLIILPITDYNNVPKHVYDLKKALERIQI